MKVGLEIHGYIKTQTKLFCPCKTVDSKPNTNICPVCTGQPGSKPQAINATALEKAIKIGLMLGCTINPRLTMQRKHYSWPDSPNNYQRTMSGSYATPVGENGIFEGIRITEVHLEEDPARWDPQTGAIDYNRAGVPLIEIVTEPDFTNVEQITQWLQKLITTLTYIDAINKTAGIKSDVNVSIEPKFERVEIKNVNSQSTIAQAVEYEVQRQEQEVANNKPIPMQTRTWNDALQETVFMRSKETAQDYMFIPDPDITSVDVKESYLQQLKETLPEPPSVKEEKLIKLGVKKDDARVLSLEFPLIVLFEELSATIPISILTTYLRREFVRIANYNSKRVDELILDQKQIQTLLTLVKEKKITDAVAQKILEKLLLDPFDVQEYIEKNNLTAVDDKDALEQICKQVIQAQEKAVKDYQQGNMQSLNFLVGQVMRTTKGAATPDTVIQTFERLLKK
ncbi:MAG: Asp-tRNA(Asn)/Glu-tRNA(Gln) amidotransferase subunit GatB [Candidatus Woesearchaeota archaeon]